MRYDVSEPLIYTAFPHAKVSTVGLTKRSLHLISGVVGSPLFASRKSGGMMKVVSGPAVGSASVNNNEY